MERSEGLPEKLEDLPEVCQRGLRACQVAPGGKWKDVQTDGWTYGTFGVPAQKWLQMRSSFRTREQQQARSDLTHEALMVARKNKS